MVMNLLAAVTNDSITISPSWPLMLWTIYFLLLLPVAAIVTGLKGHWKWLLVGLVVGGLPVLFAAFLEAEPESAWARRSAQRRARRTASA